MHKHTHMQWALEMSLYKTLLLLVATIQSLLFILAKTNSFNKIKTCYSILWDREINNNLANMTFIRNLIYFEININVFIEREKENANFLRNWTWCFLRNWKFIITKTQSCKYIFLLTHPWGLWTKREPTHIWKNGQRKWKEGPHK